VILDADDIRKQRQIAEEAFFATQSHHMHFTLALWVIAEQLYEIRSLISISLERNK
jgi:hypothetical protein